MERCFFCRKKMDMKTGLCTNPSCPRSKPLTPPQEDVSNEPKEPVTEEEVTKDDENEQVADNSHNESETVTENDETNEVSE